MWNKPHLQPRKLYNNFEFHEKWAVMNIIQDLLKGQLLKKAIKDVPIGLRNIKPYTVTMYL